MPIPNAYTGRYLFHFTHLENLPGILQTGFLSCNEQIKQMIKHRSIALSSIQERRSRMKVTCGPRGVVHDYVPLYFANLSPMLLQIVKAKNADQHYLVHFAYPIDLLNREQVVFTDAAANTNTPPNFYDDPANLDQLDWAAIDRKKWGNDSDDQKHARMAEALVHKRLDPSDAAYLIVWNESVKEEVQAIYKKAGIKPPPIEFNGHGGRYHFFLNFRKGLPEDMLNASIAPGPITTKECFLDAVKEIKRSNSTTEPEFSSISELLLALRTKGLGVLPETSELVGLESENEVHKEDVGNHTLQVVKKLRASAEYTALSKKSRRIVELAAYLHDIGKGPKSRWSACGGKQQVDPAHPLRSTEMLPRILTESLAKPGARTTRLLCMLVCYHDLIGDIIGKGRYREQLLEIVRDEEELDMLIALGKADMSSVATGWGFDAMLKLPELRAWAVAELDASSQDAEDDEADEDDADDDEAGEE